MLMPLLEKSCPTYSFRPVKNCVLAGYIKRFSVFRTFGKNLFFNLALELFRDHQLRCVDGYYQYICDQTYYKHKKRYKDFS